MSIRDQLNSYIEQLEKRLRLGAMLRGAAILTSVALAATVVLVLITNAFAFSRWSITSARVGPALCDCSGDKFRNCPAFEGPQPAACRTQSRSRISRISAAPGHVRRARCTDSRAFPRAARCGHPERRAHFGTFAAGPRPQAGNIFGCWCSIAVRPDLDDSGRPGISGPRCSAALGSHSPRRLRPVLRHSSHARRCRNPPELRPDGHRAGDRPANRHRAPVCPL